MSKNFVARSQDKHVSETRLGNLEDDETCLHLFLTDLCNDLKPQQRIKFGKLLN